MEVQPGWPASPSQAPQKSITLKGKKMEKTFFFFFSHTVSSWQLLKV